MADTLSWDDINKINEGRVRQRHEALYRKLLVGEIDESYLLRLAEAFDLYDQYRQILPSRTREEILEMLRRKGLLKKNEGVLLMEAAYRIVNQDERYEKYVANKKDVSVRQTQEKNEDEKSRPKQRENPGQLELNLDI